jgi:HK97 gp10 family phage protein
MGAPKSVVKVKKNGVEYTSNVDAAEYYIFELSRAALRDVGKFVRTKWKENYYSHFQKHSGDAGKAVSSVVLSGKKTKYPRVEIGLKQGKIDGFYAYFQEFGTSKTPKLGILTDTVESNIATIVEIESKYLSGLESEAAALALISSEGDYEDE